MRSSIQVAALLLKLGLRIATGVRRIFSHRFAARWRPLRGVRMGSLGLAVLLLTTACQLYSPTGTEPARVSVGRMLDDCATCPSMRVIRAGEFMMGSSALEPGHYDNESPQHLVRIGYAFALAVDDTTRRQYATFIADTHRPTPAGCTTMGPSRTWQDDSTLSWKNPSYAQTDDDPVTCVSWQEASAYAAWLSQKTGHHYRLPTEAEWEYAARASTSTPYWWGSTASHEYANYGTDDCCNGLAAGRDRWIYTSPAGAMPANAFGVRDMSGNVFQWVQDCWHGSFVGAPDDGSAWEDGECLERGQRGSSWHASARFVRVAYRVSWKPDGRNIYGGFRVARDLDQR